MNNNDNSYIRCRKLYVSRLFLNGPLLFTLIFICNKYFMMEIEFPLQGRYIPSSEKDRAQHWDVIHLYTKVYALVVLNVFQVTSFYVI